MSDYPEKLNVSRVLDDDGDVYYHGDTDDTLSSVQQEYIRADIAKQRDDKKLMEKRHEYIFCLGKQIDELEAENDMLREALEVVKEEQDAMKAYYKDNYNEPDFMKYVNEALAKYSGKNSGKK